MKPIALILLVVTLSYGDINFLEIPAAAVLQTVALYADGYSTLKDNGRIIDDGVYTVHIRAEESGPAKYFIGEHPTWGRMLLWGSLEVASITTVSILMRNSKNRIIHSLWWTPQLALVVLHSYCAYNNTVNYDQYLKFITKD